QLFKRGKYSFQVVEITSLCNPDSDRGTFRLPPIDPGTLYRRQSRRPIRLPTSSKNVGCRQHGKSSCRRLEQVASIHRDAFLLVVAISHIVVSSCAISQTSICTSRP